VDKFTGDGIMAVFGAPMAMENHAIRACFVGLSIQEETARLAAEVKDRDGVDLRLRVGLNSGEVIAGEIGSGVLGYALTPLTNSESAALIGELLGPDPSVERLAPCPKALFYAFPLMFRGVWWPHAG
jgi:class 3 adenylate cyclase